MTWGRRGARGAALQVRLPVDQSNRLKGIAFLVFADPSAKAKAEQLDGAPLLGRRIAVDVNPRQQVGAAAPLLPGLA
jgi:RNA recognition motif-containing protein